MNLYYYAYALCKNIVAKNMSIYQVVEKRRDKNWVKVFYINTDRSIQCFRNKM